LEALNRGQQCLPIYANAHSPARQRDLSRGALLLGEVDYGLLGGIGNFRVGAASTV
jgi:hypothetical protein